MKICIDLLWASFALGLCGCGLSVFNGHKLSRTFFSSILLGVSVLLLLAALSGWNTGFLWQAPRPIYFGVAPLLIRIDRLSALFLALLATVSFCVSLFSPGYLKHLSQRINFSIYWFCLYLFVISMALVVLSANALTFLVFWEIMSLSSVVLVAADRDNERARRSALIYLGATRIATTLLAAGFLWIHILSGSWNFADWHLAGATTVLPSILILTGLSIKAGVWPFHIWLPYAHPAAPTPVSALMSGVMIKIALYAIMRLFLFSTTTLPAFGIALLVVGAISAFWGVLFALVQHDLKRLLAYHSVENVGIIVMGIGLSLYGGSRHLPWVSCLGAAAAMFHCINHGLFKSLLFFGVGTIDAAAHTRDLSHLGGLAKSMPVTMHFFVTGSAAICALPPLNGFASKYLVYKALFELSCLTHSPLGAGLACAAIGLLALVGALAVACFTKAIGVAFLGRPRSPEAENAVEGTPAMLLCQGILAAACIALGALSPFFCQQLPSLPGNLNGSMPPAESLITLPMLPLSLFFVVISSLVFFLAYGNRKKEAVRVCRTWECGFGKLSPRMQVTATSFAHPLARIFRHVLWYETVFEIAGDDHRHFPRQIKAETATTSLLEALIYLPAIALVRRLAKLTNRLQAGSIHLYLLYMLITAIILLLIGAAT